MTASGGYIQNLIYGFGGLRLDERGLVEAYPPVLPPQWRSLEFRHLSVRGRLYDVLIDRGRNGHVQLRRTDVGIAASPTAAGSPNP